MSQVGIREQKDHPMTLHVRVTPGYITEVLELARQLGYSEDEVVATPLRQSADELEGGAREYRLRYASSKMCRAVNDALTEMTGGLRQHHHEPAEKDEVVAVPVTSTTEVDVA